MTTSLTITPEPPLTPAERAILKSYGGWTAFMQAYGLKAYDSDDIAEAKSIITGLSQQT